MSTQAAEYAILQLREAASNDGTDIWWRELICQLRQNTAAQQSVAPDRLQPCVSLVPRYTTGFQRRVNLAFCCGARLGCVPYFVNRND
jgi:hypothetical protein